MVGPSKRMFAGVAVQLFFTTGFVLTAGFAYFIRDWRNLQLALTLPGILFFSYWWYVYYFFYFNISVGFQKLRYLKIFDYSEFFVNDGVKFGLNQVVNQVVYQVYFC